MRLPSLRPYFLSGELRFRLRVGFKVEHQPQTRDIFPIRLETRCPVGTEPSIEIQYFWTGDQDRPKRPIETQRLSLSEIPTSAEAKKWEAPPVSICPEPKDRVRLLLPCVRTSGELLLE